MVHDSPGARKSGAQLTPRLFGIAWGDMETGDTRLLRGYVAGILRPGAKRINLTAIRDKYGGAWVARTEQHHGEWCCRVWCMKTPTSRFQNLDPATKTGRVSAMLETMQRASQRKAPKKRPSYAQTLKALKLAADLRSIPPIEELLKEELPF